MTSPVHSFIADWFQRFDRLDPVEAFLPDLHPDVVWDMPDIDPNLHGHARFKAWYAAVLDTLVPPTEHHLSNITVAGNTATFNVQLRARTRDGTTIQANVREDWHFTPRADGTPLITHYTATFLQELPA